MNKRRFSLLALILGAVLGIALTGCDAEFIGDAARRSLSSFAIDVFSTAVNETVNP